ncbi:MAG: hypothetical protein WBC04_23330 [Candidatus Acidiferrales bacterium]
MNSPSPITVPTTQGHGRARFAAFRMAQRTALLGTMLAAMLVIFPMFFLGNASGHDFDFHVASWVDVAQQWHQGIWYPRWAAWANYGFGEPRFIFYPPTSWMLGAALGSVLPWRIVPGLLILMTLLLAGMAMFRLGCEWLAPGEAIPAAIFFAVNPYHLLMIYYRSDFSELIASALFPLLVVCALRIGRDGAAAMAPISLVFAAIWLSNAPEAVLASYSLALLLAVVCLVRKTGRPLAPGAAAIAMGLGLAAFYILPAAWEQRWVAIGEVLASGLRPEQNFLFTQASNPEFVIFNWKVSGVVLLVIGMTGIASVFAARRRRSRPELWWMMLALAGLAVAMMFPLSVFVWRYLPKLRFVQFPWRWLGPMGAPCALFLGAAVGQVRKKWVWWVAIGIVLGVLAGLIIRDTWWDSEDVPTLVNAVRSNRGYEGADEYEPRGCDRYNLPDDAPRLTLHNLTGDILGPANGVRVHVQRWAAESKIISVDSPRELILALKLLNYPAWNVEVNGKEAQYWSREETGQIMVSLQAGPSRVEIRFHRTRDRTLGILISLTAALLIAALLIFWKPRKALAGRPGLEAV